MSLNVMMVPPSATAEITREKFSKICRCCIIHEGQTNVFEAHIENLPLSQVIFICTNELIHETDGLSRLMCNDCVQLFINSYNFIKTFKESQKKLMNMNVSFNIESGVSENVNVKGNGYGLISNAKEISKLDIGGKKLEERYISKNEISEMNERMIYPHKKENSDLEDFLLDLEETSEKVNYRKPNKRIEVDPNLRSGLDLQCFQCLSMFPSKADIVRHHKSTGHTMAPNYKCGICSKAISKRKAYWDHMAMHRHLQTKAVCEKCGAVVVSLHLKRHMLVHQEKTHICKYCGKGYVQKNTLRDHIKKKHEGEGKEMNTLCFICGTLCTDLKGLTTHLNTHSENKLKELSHQCSDCGKYFLNAQSLSTHTYMAHKIAQRVPKQHKRSKIGRQKLRRLPKEERETTKAKTEETKKPQKEKGTTKREPQECPICHKIICFLGYRRHLTTHTGVKPHQCKMCSKTFRLYTSLKSHMYVHLNLKPFKCEICEQQFRHYTTLKVHKRVHTGEKPYSCPVCSKCFRSASGLKRHQNQRQHHQAEREVSQN